LLEAYRQTARARFWPRRLPPTIRVVSAALALTCAAIAAPQPDSAEFPGPLGSFLDDVRSFRADFEQRLWTADGRLVEISSGYVAVKRPRQFRWIYTDPIETELVTDGSIVWMYDVDIAQVTRSRLDQASDASPAMLLSGDAAVRNSFIVESTSERDGVQWITLRPKFSGSEFGLIRLGFDQSLLVGMELVDGLDQTTAIVFSSVELNVELDDELFEFKVPNGVHVLGEG